MDYSVKFKAHKFNKTVPVLEVSIDEKGNKILIQKDTIEPQRIINSYKDSCSIERIIARFNLGDESVLHTNEGVYINKETAQALLSDKQENKKSLNATYAALYATFSQTHDISYDKMVELIQSGKVNELEKYVIKPKEGGAE